MKFKTSSGIKSIVGKDLITDSYVAIFELVKNSYDAKASNVVISFNSDKNTEPYILIRDDGKGMSKKDLEEKWLYLAYSEKKEGRDNSDRVYVGSKGIGRFSSDRLGKKLTLSTKTANENIEHNLVVNWDDFDKNLSTNFEEIDVTYSSRKLVDNQSSYTELLITNLRQDWNDIESESIEKAIELLQRLKNPFLESDGFNIFCGKNIFEINGANIDEIKTKHLVQSNVAQVLKDRAISISARIGNEIEIKLSDRGKRIFQVSKENDTRLKDVDINIEVNYLTASAKNMFTRRMGVQPVNFGNVFIYRNGFHVSPYGDKDSDLFGLNIRKGQGYKRFISHREIIGHISIKDPENKFKETSSRNNGFVDNVYFSSLEDFYMEFIHRALETYVKLVKWGEVEKTEEVVDWSSVDESAAEKYKASVIRRGKVKDGIDFELDYFTEDLEFDSIKKKRELERVIRDLPKAEAKPIKEVVKKLKESQQVRDSQLKAINKQRTVIKDLERQNTNLGARRSETSYGEQVGHHLTSMSSILSRELKKLNKFKEYLNTERQDEFISSLHKVRRIQMELDQFKNLLIKTDSELRSAQSINWFELTKWHFENKRISKKFKITYSIKGEEFMPSWVVKSKSLEFVMMLENLYMNAKQHGGSYLDIVFDEDNIEFLSDSNLIEEVNLERIFELGFTTSDGGTGIGLHQVKSFFQKHGFDIKAKNDKRVVCFTVQNRLKNK